MLAEAYLKYAFIPLVAAVVTYVATPLCAGVLRRLGMVDLPDQRRVHARPTPRGGGVAVFAGVAAGVLAIFLVPWFPFKMSWSPGLGARYLVTAGVVVLVGLADDRFGLDRYVKLLCQVTIGMLAYTQGFAIDHLLFLELPAAVGFLLTVFWIVALMNAFNLIDGMDGLAAGLATIAALGLAGSMLLRGLPGDALVYLVLAGACVSFLRYNFHPASIFLGDAGSLFLGYSVAVMSLVSNTKGTVLATLGVSVLALGIPVLDVTLAVWRRTARRLGGSAAGIFDVDMDHLHHRLMGYGLSQRKVSLLLYLLNLGLVAVGLLALGFHSRRFGIFLLAFVVFTYIVVRHLARVELWASSRALVRGFVRPAPKVLAVVCYPLVDVMILSAALTLILLFMVGPAWSGSLKRAWLQNAPLWVGVPFLGIVCSRAYLRVWSRARVMDYAILAAGLLGAVAVCMAVVTLLENVWWGTVCLQGLAYVGLVLPGLIAARVLLRIAQEWLAFAAAEYGERRDAGVRTVIYGAGMRGMEYMRFLMREHFDHGHVRVLGWLDDDPNMGDRLVYGLRVLGGLAQLEGILKEHRVGRIVLTIDLADANLARLQALAQAMNVEVQRWNRRVMPA